MLRVSTSRRSVPTRTLRSITRRPARMTGEGYAQRLLDTNIVILRRWLDPAELPDEMAISVITLAELSAGPHEVRGNDEQNAYEEHAERARRLEILERAETSSIRFRSTPKLLASTGVLRPLWSERSEERRVGKE